jgi:hypothetical protein
MAFRKFPVSVSLGFFRAFRAFRRDRNFGSGRPLGALVSPVLAAVLAGTAVVSACSGESGNAAQFQDGGLDGAPGPWDAANVPMDGAGMSDGSLIGDASPMDANGPNVNAGDGATTADAGTDANADGGTGPSFDGVYAILDAACAGCHDGQDGDMDLSTRTSAYASLINQSAQRGPCNGNARVRVKPGAPTESLLYTKISATHDCGFRMPNKTPLEASKIEVVRQWIAGGAQDR